MLPRIRCIFARFVATITLTTSHPHTHSPPTLLSTSHYPPLITHPNSPTPGAWQGPRGYSQDRLPSRCAHAQAVPAGQRQGSLPYASHLEYFEHSLTQSRAQRPPRLQLPLTHLSFLLFAIFLIHSHSLSSTPTTYLPPTHHPTRRSCSSAATTAS